MTWPARSHTCGGFREGDAGTAAAICGWVDGYRNMGGVLFLDVRDHTGILQARAPRRRAAAAPRDCAPAHRCTLPPAG